MERNADDTFGSTGGQGSTGGTNAFGASGTSGAGMGGSVGSGMGGSDYSTTGTQSDMGQSRTEQAKATVQDKLGQVKEKARDLQSTLADKLDAGADKLRQRTSSGTMAGATDGGSVGMATENRMANVQDSTARAMSKSADWLRNGDLKGDIEKQVRENPGRTLLIALGLGYVLGKAFRGNNR
jgi:hypothetical protein